MPLVSGATAAGFNIVRLLGCGHIGELYLAEHPRLPRRHALKILPVDVSADPEYRERFHRESALAATLWHPHIVSLYDRGEFEGRLWLSMDYVDGTDAAQLLSDTYPGGMPPDAVVEIVSAIAEALDYAHDHDLLHRYVKPSNILITQSASEKRPASEKRRILLANFGVAQRLDDINSLTQVNTPAGTVSYAAPEQLMGNSIDGRADQYALAVTAFHLLTGSPPFAHSNPAVVISRHLNESPPRTGDLRQDLAHFDEPFARALAKLPTDRFPRCQDFADALEEKQRKQSNLRDAGATAVVPQPAPSPETVLPPPALATPPDADTVALALAQQVASTPPDADTVALALAQQVASTPPDADTVALAQPVAPTPPAAAIGNAFVLPNIPPNAGIDNAVMSSKPALSGAITDGKPVASRHRRRLQTAAFALATTTVALVGFMIVMALRSASEFQDTPATVENPSSSTAIPPALPAPATATLRPTMIAPAPENSMPPLPTTAPAPETTMPPVSGAPPLSATTATPLTNAPPPLATTKPSSRPPKPPAADLDTRPAFGMPCGPQQAGTTTTSNSGISVSCVETPGGFAWESAGGN
jgi:serine/threonine protein kinase, bacterial